jgi:hypothetical protein
VNFTGNASVPLFRRDAVVDLGGYDTSPHAGGYQGCEDWDLAIRVAERHEVAVVPQALVAYRRRSGAMSTSCDVMWSSQAHVIDAFAARHPDVSAAILERSKGQFALYLAGVSFWAGHYLSAWRWALRARPFRLLAAVAPHIGRLLMSRIGGWFRRAARPTLTGSRFADGPLPQPSIPYSAIYARHWMRERSAAGSAIERC